MRLARAAHPPRRWRRPALVAVTLLVVAIALFFSTFAASPLRAPPPLAGPLPSASPPPAMSVFQLPTGVTHRSAAFAYRGGSFFDARDFAMTAVLVRHPRGDVLVDTGFGRDVDAHLRSMPIAFRAITRYTRGVPAADRLAAAGYELRKLRAILLTHAHWDHVSGVPDFPGTPVWVTTEERQFVEQGGALTVVARNAPSVRYEEYGFEGGPYLGFPRSHDVYGDGAIVVVPAPGHTPGSVVVFLALPSGARYALVGDLVWQREGITEREERPWLQRTLGDHDPAAVRENILRMAAIAARFPEIVLAPAHDARGFVGMAGL
jgi:glyoxylase-like metal-dependent hydrolase (beta-lactamase superfamily II)